jgi:hypothetical protein
MGFRHFWTDASTWLNSHTFLSLHILQHIIIIISIAKGTSKELFIRLVALSDLGQVGTTIPISSQQSLAKEPLKNK